MIWRWWLGFADARAREWDRRSMDKIAEAGGTATSANLAWGDIERTRGTYDWSYVDHRWPRPRREA
jgi:hypothetical protein